MPGYFDSNHSYQRCDVMVRGVADDGIRRFRVHRSNTISVLLGVLVSCLVSGIGAIATASTMSLSSKQATPQTTSSSSQASLSQEHTTWQSLRKNEGFVVDLRSLPNREAQVLTLALHAEEITARLESVMDTSTQAAASEGAPAVRMTTCSIVLDGDIPDGYPTARFLYQEQALIEQLDQPYRQRFLAIAPDSISNSVQSITLRPPHPEQWIGLCDRPDTDRIVHTEELGETTCRVFLRPFTSGYIGKTPIGGCPATVRGAVTITNTVILHDDGMDTWDRGFDTDGNQVWGATTTPYQYRWSDMR